MNKNKAREIFKALGEETRFRIIEVLIKKETCACKIPEMINRTQSNTSMHLKNLLNLGLIKSRREGKMILYSIADDNLKQIMRLIR